MHMCNMYINTNVFYYTHMGISIRGIVSITHFSDSDFPTLDSIYSYSYTHTTHIHMHMDGTGSRHPHPIG